MTRLVREMTCTRDPIGVASLKGCHLFGAIRKKALMVKQLPEDSSIQF